MGASETKILYQKDIADLFPAGEINLDNACDIVKCTPTPKNTIEDFSNKTNNNYLFLFILLFLFLLIFLFYNT
jgi:hypothetical protein